jgi:hypothetical protein
LNKYRVYKGLEFKFLRKGFVMISMDRSCELWWKIAGIDRSCVSWWRDYVLVRSTWDNLIYLIFRAGTVDGFLS